MYVYRNKVLITNINGSGLPYLNTSSLGLTGARLGKICWTQSADTLVVVHPSIPPIKIVRGATNADWTGSAITFDSVPKYAFTLSVTNPAATLTPSAVSGKITLTASASVFTSGSVGQYVNASPQGRAKIVAYTSGTVVSAITEFPFFNSSAIASGSWDYESGYEAVWSATKGYPATVTFHEGRLYFGGSESRPSTIGILFSFRIGTELSSQA